MWVWGVEGAKRKLGWRETEAEAEKKKKYALDLLFGEPVVEPALDVVPQLVLLAERAEQRDDDRRTLLVC